MNTANLYEPKIARDAAKPPSITRNTMIVETVMIASAQGFPILVNLSLLFNSMIHFKDVLTCNINKVYTFRCHRN
jgi:hypothetical protein